MSTPRYNLTILQGATYRRTFTWFGDGKAMHEIEDIEVGYPTVLTVTAHGLSQLSKTPVFIEGVKGASALNTKECKASEATYLTDDTFSVETSTQNKEWVEGTGVVTWYVNSDISTYTARMQLRERRDDEEIIIELTTENDRITLDDDGNINLFIDADSTAALDFKTAVYDLELIDSNGIVTRLVEGDVTLKTEVTR